MDHISHTVFDGVLYDLIKRVLGVLVMTGAAQVILTYAFNKLKKRKEIIAFWVGSFVLLSALIYLMGSRPQQPELIGSIQQALAGAQGERDTVVILALNVLNKGSMQTILKNWKVTAESNGNKYEAIFAQMPEQFTFKDLPRVSPSQPISMTFHSSDSILEKSLTPIQVGALLPGIVFVVFQNVDPSIFKSGVLYTVTFEDVFSTPYSASIQATARSDIVGSVPGLRTQMACPVPPSGIPKIGNELLKKLD